MEDNAKTIINVAGDYVQSKHVDYEINNVEAAVRGHAVSWWFCYRFGAYHGLLLRHCQRQGMFDVPPRHQPRGTIIKVSARTRADIFFAFFSCICQKNVVSLHRFL